MKDAGSYAVVIESHAFAAPDVWRSEDPTSFPGGTVDVFSSSPLGDTIFPRVDRVSLRPAPIRCMLPNRAVGLRIPDIDIFGTADLRLSRVAELVALVSASVVVPLGRTLEGRPPVWSELAARPGMVIAQQPIDPQLLPRIVDQALTPIAELDVRSLYLGRLIESARSTAVAGLSNTAKLPQTGLQRIRAFVELEASQDLDDSSIHCTADIVGEPDEGVHGGSLALTVSARVGGALDDERSSDLGKLLHAVIDHTAGHLYLVQLAQSSLRRQSRLFDELSQSMTLSGEQRTLRDIRRLRAEHVRTLLGAWGLGVGVSKAAREMIAAIDEAVGLTRRWEAHRIQLDVLGQSYSDFVAFPSTAEIERLPEPDPSSGLILHETNPVKQLWRIFRPPKSDVTMLDGSAPPATVHDAHRTRDIELHPFANRDAIFQELQASLTVTTLMTATAGIILGVVLQQSQSQIADLALDRPVDVIFLFVSTFAFFFSTLVCANAAGQLARRSSSGVEVKIDRANAVAEYLGKYPFIIAVPTAVIRFIGPDSGPESGRSARFVVCLIVTILGWLVLVLYHWYSGLSLLETQVGDAAFGSDRFRRFVSLLIMFLAIAIFAGALFQRSIPAPYELAAAVLLLAVLLFLTMGASFLPRHVEEPRYTVDYWDAMGEEQASWNDTSWRERSQRPGR